MESSEEVDFASECSKLGDLIRSGAEGLGNGGETSGEDALRASLKEIQKMDAILKVKLSEERRAKLSRIEAEEELRVALSELPCPETSERFKVNLEEFLGLLNDVGRSEEGLSSLPELTETDDTGENEEGKGKSNFQERTAPPLTFVKKNILLAKCGRGTLSLTDEEKGRIENLLVEVESSDSDSKAPSGEDMKPDFEAKESFALDDNTRSVLREIDRRLEELRKLKSLKEPRGKQVLPEKSENLEEGVKGNPRKEKEKEKKEPSRLEAINKLLSSMNLASNDVIHPLSEEELGSLLRESEERPSPRLDGLPKGVDLSPDVVTELVSSAKSLMPRFKYRFNEV